MTAIERTVRMRVCALPACPVRFESPHHITGVPAKYHSAACHRASKTPAPAKSRTRLVTQPSKKAPRAISPASPEQRANAAAGGCVVCGLAGCHPAHLIDRSLAADPDGDAHATVRLCPAHHAEYDDDALSLLEHLEPHHRDALAYAVQRFGLIRTLERVTNQRWAPVTKDAA